MNGRKHIGNVCEFSFCWIDAWEGVEDYVFVGVFYEDNLLIRKFDKSKSFNDTLIDFARECITKKYLRGLS